MRFPGRSFGILMIAVSAVSFGFLPIFARYAYDDGMNTFTLLFLRFTLASAVMLGVMRRFRLGFPRGRRLAGLVLMGGVGYVGQSFCYFTALKYASAGLVALLLYVYPVIVAVLSILILKEPPTGRKIASIVLATAGTALIVGFQGTGRPLGILLGLGAAVIYSLYIVAGSRIVPRDGEIASSAVVIMSAAAVYGIISFATGPRFPNSPSGMAAVLGIALISTSVAILTFFFGLRRIGPTTASLVSTLEPLVTVLLAMVLLGETLPLRGAAGGALILFAVVFPNLPGGAGSNRVK